MQEIKSEGVILHALNFGDYDQILTLFTADYGLIKLMVKRALAKKGGQGALTTPLTRVEFIMAKGRSDLFLCRELSLVNQHLQLRNSWESLSAAGDMVQALQATQLQLKPAPLIYALFTCYLDNLPSSSAPDALAASFRLKILRHEGLFGPTPACCHCNVALVEQSIATGQSYCREHAPAEAVHFSGAESETLILLTYGRSFAVLTASPLSLKEKVRIIFNDCFSCC